MAKHRIAVIGLGVVGMGFVKLLAEKEDALKKDHDLSFSVVAVCDKIKGSLYNADGIDIARVVEEGPDAAGLEGEKGLSSFEIIEKEDVDVVIEATPTNLKTGGVGLKHAKTALSLGKHFISTNKGPPAIAFSELMHLAEENDAYYGYEGTVLSGTPAINLALSGLAGSDFCSIRGILNGTTNFMLEKMENGKSYDEALQIAKENGYAESDPSGDVEGWDASAKVAILANALLKAEISPDDVERTGVRNVTREDVRNAQRIDRKIKLISSLIYEKGKLVARVAPELVSCDDPLYHVSGVLNAITFETDTTGNVTIIGPGAGGRSAGYAMLHDLIVLNRRLSK
ncbi:MAG: homoserine dehydrogenase [Candidatus Methanofastidiosia archaeon]